MTPVEIDAAILLAHRAQFGAAVWERCSRTRQLLAKTDELVAASQNLIAISKAILKQISRA